MHTPAPQDKGASQVRPVQVEQLRLLRSADIEGFLTGTLSLAARDGFLAEIAANHNLRLAVISMRDHRTLLDPNVTEVSVALLESLGEAIGQFNSFFPNAPGRGEEEQRDLWNAQRKLHFDAAMRLADDLLREGGLEDLALENRWIAKTNWRNAEALSEFYLTRGKDRVEEQELVKGFSVPCLRSSGTGALLPLGLPTRYFRDLDLSGANFPGRELHRENGSMVSAEILLSPINPHEARPSVLLKLQEVERLLGSIVSEGMNGREDILRKVFLQYFPGPIFGPKSKYSAEYFCAMAEQVARVADQNENVWQVIKPAILLSINSGIFGIDNPMVPERHRRPVLVSLLAELPNRLHSDDVLTELANLSLTQIPSVAQAACAALGQLAPDYAVPYLINIISRHPGPDLRPGIERKDPFEKQGAVQPEILALLRLSEFSAADLNGAMISVGEREGRIPLSDYVEHYLNIRATSRISTDFTPRDEALFDLLAKLDNGAAERCAKQRLSRWHGSINTFPFLASTIDRHFSDGMAEEVVSALTRTVGSHIHRLPDEVVGVLKHSWNLTREQLVRWGGKQLGRLLNNY